MDEKTPNPGISIELINLKNDEIQEITHSDDNGRFTFFPPKGKWNLRVLTDKGYVYHQTNGKVTEINTRRCRTQNHIWFLIKLTANQIRRGL